MRRRPVAGGASRSGRWPWLRRGFRSPHRLAPHSAAPRRRRAASAPHRPPPRATTAPDRRPAPPGRRRATAHCPPSHRPPTGSAPAVGSPAPASTQTPSPPAHKFRDRPPAPARRSKLHPPARNPAATAQQHTGPQAKRQKAQAAPGGRQGGQQGAEGRLTSITCSTFVHFAACRRKESSRPVRRGHFWWARWMTAKVRGRYSSLGASDAADCAIYLFYIRRKNTELTSGQKHCVLIWNANYREFQVL